MEEKNQDKGKSVLEVMNMIHDATREDKEMILRQCGLTEHEINMYMSFNFESDNEIFLQKYRDIVSKIIANVHRVDL
jgi:hypothetical protein